MDAATIEQMNKVRVSLGMAPLPVPGGGPQFKPKDESDSGSESDDFSTLDKRQAAAGSNWQKLEGERQDKIDRQKRKDAAKKARDAAQRFSKLQGKGLGEADEGEGELDTRAWLLQQKKRQKKIEKARKLEEELAARELQAEYTSKDLAGVKVGHEAAEFDETTGEQILTLKDAEIGDESEEDELENADLKAKEKLEEKQKLKKKRPDYDPTEQDGQQQSVLSKYDDEIDGKKQKRFTLDGEGSTATVANQALDADGQMKGKGVKISLDMLNDDAPISDYLDPSTVKIKKPKKQKKEKTTRQKPADEDDIFPTAQPTDTDAMQLDRQPTNGTTTSKKRAFDFNDDDDLQAKLAEQRRQTLKKRKKMDAAELARQMREEMPVDDDNQDDGGWTIDETTEFVENLKKPEAPESRGRHSGSPQPANAASPGSDDEDGDTAMANQSYADVEEAVERKRDTSTSAADVTATGLDDEETMTNQGIGASLALLRKRGLVNASADEKLSERERARSKFLAEKQHLIDEFDVRARQQREEERRRGTWDKMSNRDREAYQKQQNEARERYLNQLLDDEFKRNYKPNVELRYTDEFGRAMNQREAFKHMSHMFHGKGSGKGKTEKRLKKIEDERKEQMKGVLNVGAEEGGMSVVQGREGKKNKQAGIRLQ
jgi:U4/U6.U5 tri-snRNP-associated protein 1